MNVDKGDQVHCLDCDGTGETECWACRGLNDDCPVCYDGVAVCDVCDGRGWHWENEQDEY